MNVQLQEIKNMYIKNRLTEGVDFKRYEWLDSSNSKVWIQINENDFQSLIMYRIGNPNTEIMLTTHPNYGTHGMFFNFESWLPGFAWYNPDTHYVAVNEQNLQFSLTKSGDNIIYKGNSTKTINYPMNKLLTIVVCNNMTRLKSISTSTGQYIPCKLLQDIPASLSINNKAYTADTCGLYYTTTGKFIGNSNLTVEGEVEPETHTGLQQIYQNRLIEGVDYETADWLKADIPISTYMMQLPLNSRNFEFKRNMIQVMNTSYFNSKDNESFNYYIADQWDGVYNLIPRIYNNTTRKVVYNPNVNIGLGLHIIICDDSGVSINNAQLPLYGNPVSIGFNNVNNINKHTIHLTSSIKVDGVTRYIPCQLLHSIPRNLDAQCKERVAGECGMIDLISGKFYGNVASSGTFTVENNNE